MKVLNLRRPGICAECGRALPTGERVRYYSSTKMYCYSHTQSQTTTTNQGQPEAASASTASSDKPVRIILGLQNPVAAGEMIWLEMEGVICANRKPQSSA